MISSQSRSIFLAVAILVLPVIALAQGKGHQKISVCHSGDGGNAHTLTLPEPALQAHLKHGDTLGACGGFGNVHNRPIPQTGSRQNGPWSDDNRGRDHGNKGPKGKGR